MIDVAQFRSYVVRPTLTQLGLYSAAAENLLVGTALQESGLRMLHQVGGGPALGIYQIEPATHRDIWDNFLRNHHGLESLVVGVAAKWPELEAQLICNLAYATCIARLIYYRAPEPLPVPYDIRGLGAYYKKFYNTPLGAATVEQWVANYLQNGGAP